MISAPWSTASGSSPVDVFLEVDVNTYLPDDLLVKIDIATMAHSLEARSPFLDPTVMEFAASLPANYKLRNGRKKWILREAYRGVVQATSSTVRKRASPHRSLNGFAPGWGTTRATCFSTPQHWRAAICVSKRLSRSSTLTLKPATAPLQIWTLMMLELWHREFVDCLPGAPVPLMPEPAALISARAFPGMANSGFASSPGREVAAAVGVEQPYEQNRARIRFICSREALVRYELRQARRLRLARSGAVGYVHAGRAGAGRVKLCNR